MWLVVLGALSMLTGCGKRTYHPKHLEHISAERAHCVVTKDNVSVYARTMSREDKKYYFKPTNLDSSSIKVVQLTIANQRASAVVIHRRDLNIPLRSEDRLMNKLGFFYGPHLTQVGLGGCLLSHLGLTTAGLIAAFSVPSFFLGYAVWYGVSLVLLGSGLSGYKFAVENNTALRLDLLKKMLPEEAVIQSHEVASYLLFYDKGNHKESFLLRVYDQGHPDQHMDFTIDLAQQKPVTAAI